ncbi:MAG: hypothetical protein EHM48_08385 [Planctomycetaceae bacterium]|nr:MAG: hypothetical protein EHM48_08385 [Planctomycetaceae bacterium]
MTKSILTVLTMLSLSALVGCGGAGQTNYGDEEFTISLRGFVGPDHNQQSERYLRETQKLTGWPNLYVVHEENGSALLWGKYRNIEAAQDDLKTAKAWKTPIKEAQPPYAKTAMIVPIPGLDNYGPPEMNLLNAKGYYTMMVAVFMDSPAENIYGHRKSAVEYCQTLRKKGWDAYYVHNNARSCVTIGTFEKTALRTRKRPALFGSGIGTEIGLQPFIEVNDIVDPKMMKIKRDFPNLLVNGKVERIVVVAVEGPSQGREVALPSESCPIIIPQRGENAGIPAAGSGNP